MSSTRASLLVVGAVLASVSKVSAFDGSQMTCSTGIQVGPNLGKGLACVDFSVDGGDVNTGCIGFDEASPFLPDGASDPLPGATWCATVADYDSTDTSVQRNWGYCCPLAEDVTEAPVVTPTVYITSGGYVAENTVCRFPLTKGDVTYDACIPFIETTPRNGATAPKAPKVGDTATWCYTGPGALPVNYNTLTNANKEKWGYCRVQVPTAAPTTKSPTVKSTKSPTARPTTKMPTVKPTKSPTGKPTTKAPTLSKWVSSGGYAAEGSACKIPFKNLGNGRTYTACAPYANAAGTPLPFIANTPPAQPTEESIELGVSNQTWCYTGTGDYSPTMAAKRKLWAFCGERIVITTAPTPEQTSAPSPDGPTEVPSVTTAPSGDNTDAPTSEPSAPPSIVPTTASPSLPPGVTASPTPPTASPSTASPVTSSPAPVTAPPSSVTTAPTPAPTNASNITRSPTVQPTNAASQQALGMMFAFASAVVAMVVA